MGRCCSFGCNFWLDVWLGLLMSQHEQIIVEFMEQNPQWQRFKLREFLNKTFKNIEKQEQQEYFKNDEWADPFPTLNYIPDGFFIDVENTTLHLLEVDGTSGTTKGKLEKMVDLWWGIDGMSWCMTLTSISVYTKAKSFMSDDDFFNLALQYEIDKAKREKNALHY